MKRTALLLLLVCTLAWAGEPETVTLRRDQVEAMVGMILHQRALLEEAAAEVERARKAERDAKTMLGCA